MAQRIVRAKRKIVEAGIPYRMPDADELSERLDEVLAVLYLAFNEGYLATSGPSPARRDLAEDACWLSTLLMRLLPNEPEVIGLVALMQLHLARATVRFDRAGGLILLKDQDRSRWDQRSIREASTMLERASWLRRPGPYQLQAAIAACHAEATSWEATDWAQILLLYNSLLIFWPTPVVRLAETYGSIDGKGILCSVRRVEEDFVLLVVNETDNGLRFTLEGLPAKLNGRTLRRIPPS